MQLVIDIKENAIDKILYFLEHCKEDVKILKKEDDDETLSKEEMQELQKLSQMFKNGEKEEFVEYDV